MNSLCSRLQTNIDQIFQLRVYIQLTSSTLVCWLFLWKWNIRKKSFCNIKNLVENIVVNVASIIHVWPLICLLRVYKIQHFLPILKASKFFVFLCSLGFISVCVVKQFFYLSKISIPPLFTIPLPILYFPYLIFYIPHVSHSAEVRTSDDRRSSDDLHLINKQNQEVSATNNLPKIKQSKSLGPC